MPLKMVFLLEIWSWIPEACAVVVAAADEGVFHG
jgi:hypothetical protein